jgi:hypothetical protein
MTDENQYIETKGNHHSNFGGQPISHMIIYPLGAFKA